MVASECKTSIKKNDYIRVKNHALHEGEIFRVKQAKSDGWIVTTEGHLFEPSFFDPVSDWQQYNGGFARFNQTTSELVEQRCLKKYLLQRFSSDGLDEWVTPEIIANEMGLDEALIEQWLVNNESSVERDGDLCRYKKGDFTFEIETKIKELSERASQPVVQKEARLKKRLDERLIEWEAALHFKIGDRVVKDDKQGNLADWSMAGDIIQAMVFWDDMTVPVPEKVLNLSNSEQSEVKFLDNAPSSDPQSDDQRGKTSLSHSEREHLHYLESLIESSFVVVGKSLKEIRDRRLYRATHLNFDSYCRDRWKMVVRSAERKIVASDIYETIRLSLRPNWSQQNDENSLPLPKSESQLRPIADSPLASPDQVLAWELSIEQAYVAGKKQPTASIVKKVVADMTKKEKPNSHKVGDVCKYVGVTGKAGIWCVVRVVGEFSCTVEDYAELDVQVRVDEIKEMELNAEEKSFMHELLPQLQSLFDTGHEIFRHSIAFFGRLNRGYLSPSEDKVLNSLHLAKISLELEEKK